MDPFRDRLKVTNREYSLNVLESKARSLGLTVSNPNEETYRKAILAWMEENNYGEAPRVSKSPTSVSKSPTSVNKSQSKTVETNINFFENLPTEILLEIAKNTPDEDILNLCQTNSSFYNLCNDVSFWSRRALDKGYIFKLEDFGEFGDEDIWLENNYGDYTPQERYLELLSNTRCVPGSEKYVVKSFIDYGREYNICALKAATEGNIKNVKYFLEKGGDIDNALTGAIFGGHLELVKILIEVIIKLRNLGLYVSGQKIDIGILNDLFEDKAVANDDLFFKLGGQSIINMYLITAVEGGHLEIVKYLVEKRSANDFYRALNTAIVNGKIEIVKYLYDNIIASNINEDRVYALLHRAVFNKKWDILKFLLAKLKGFNLFYVDIQDELNEQDLMLIPNDIRNDLLLEGYNL